MIEHLIELTSLFSSNPVKLDVRIFILYLSCQILNYRMTLDAVLTLTPLELGVGISQH